MYRESIVSLIILFVSSYVPDDIILACISSNLLAQMLLINSPRALRGCFLCSWGEMIKIISRIRVLIQWSPIILVHMFGPREPCRTNCNTLHLTFIFRYLPDYKCVVFETSFVKSPWGFYCNFLNEIVITPRGREWSPLHSRVSVTQCHVWLVVCAQCWREWQFSSLQMFLSLTSGISLKLL